MLTTTLLKPRFDARKSFYNKAEVNFDAETNTYTLQSYTTEVASICNGKVKINGEYSKTTMRHIREFLAQFAPTFDTTLKNIRKNILETANA